MKKNTANKKTLKKLTYEHACFIAAIKDFWKAEDAARLLVGLIPRGLNGHKKLSGAEREKVCRLSFVIRDADCIENPDAPEERHRVRPKHFLEWAETKGFAVPSVLSDQLRKQEDREEQQPSYERRSSVHRNRRRGFAQRLWAKHPAMTILDMTRHEDITQFGCEGKEYSEKTIRNWIKDLCPNRNPGRRPNNKLPAI